MERRVRYPTTPLMCFGQCFHIILPAISIVKGTNKSQTKINHQNHIKPPLKFELSFALFEGNGINLEIFFLMTWNGKLKYILVSAAIIICALKYHFTLSVIQGNYMKLWNSSRNVVIIAYKDFWFLCDWPFFTIIIIIQLQQQRTSIDNFARPIISIDNKWCLLIIWYV